jgi:hypothetical protein
MGTPGWLSMVDEAPTDPRSSILHFTLLFSDL